MNAETFSIKAVFVGWLVDMLGTFIVAGVIGVIAGLMLGASGTTPQQIESELAGATGLQILSLFVGLFFTGLGGYIAARVGNTSEMMHAFATGILALLTGILLTAAMPESTSQLPRWYQAASWILTLPSALMGGYVRSRQVAL